MGTTSERNTEMSHRKLGLKALGLSFLAALGLMAFMAAGAQANWLVLSATTQLENNENVAVKTHEDLEFKLLVAAQGLEILCLTVESDGLKLKGLSTMGEGAVNFRKCKTWQVVHGVNTEQKGCVPKEPILAEGKGKLVLHNSLTWVLLEPPTVGGSLALIEFNPATCALSEDSEITGSLLVECGHLTTGAFVAENCATLALTHLFRAAPNQALLSDGLFFDANPAVLDGIAAASLSGRNENVAVWGGDGP
jgi:hypothetical protein